MYELIQQSKSIPYHPEISIPTNNGSKQFTCTSATGYIDNKLDMCGLCGFRERLILVRPTNSHCHTFSKHFTL